LARADEAAKVGRRLRPWSRFKAAARAVTASVVEAAAKMSMDSDRPGLDVSTKAIAQRQPKMRDLTVTYPLTMPRSGV
jgi:hypothetical protein